jgi:N utilization substance protein B
VGISRLERADGQAVLVDRIVFTASLVLGTVAHVEQIDAMISEHARHWRVDRLGLVEKSILRLGGYELVYEEETPSAVVIDEAVELAKRFSDPDAGSFVNGVLDGMSKHLRT